MNDDLRCRWMGSDNPRAIIGRHSDDCRRDECRGCEPCHRAHCRVCGIEHAAGACAGCVGTVREDLSRIAELCGSLPGEAEVRGVDGEVFNLLGPVTDIEAWGHRAASILSGRIVPMDCDFTELEDVRAWLEKADHERHPLWVLGRWQEIYADHFEHTLKPHPDVLDAAAYLGRNLGYAADFADEEFERFADEVAKCRMHVEKVLHADEQIERGAPCPTCHKPLTLTYGRRLVDDRWVCLTRWCEVEDYTRSQYRGWVEDNALHEATRLTATDMARRFRDENDMPRVKAGEIRVWGSREKIRKCGTDPQGITLYDVAEVEAMIDARDESARPCA